MDTLYFHDDARSAAEHLLDGPFGARLRELVTVEANEAHGYLEIRWDYEPTDFMSSGECVMFDVLRSLAGNGRVDLTDLTFRLDDAHWDRIIGALFVARGRIVAVSS